ILNPSTYARWLGFPKSWELIQGLFWYGFGSINAVVVPQIVLCLIYFYYAYRTLGIPVAYTILAFFSSPMLLGHFESTYPDLPAGIGIALGFLVLTGLV